ncbi:UV DNA damage repair endonuclease UvsE [Chitinispirillales bacterium ANBcel5]|uniref:UV DNA damage repair endonuclease UvsE n=1 Tax=Cellulosispirillum alkaliphilum TaxID=3039283 RepID=UPI002A590014|nr:UV DNA damage repair endonuclease UvsE [Chitinispirillales bacterium ANBcel5]
MIRLGYACINTSLPTSSRSFRLANYTEERMIEVSGKNISALMNILQWNLKRGIMVFRISSGLIPLGSHPVNSGAWKAVLKKELEDIGTFVKENGMRVSMHPGQYTVLNTPNETTYKNTLLDLQYHTSVLECMGLDCNHVLVLHGGGVYGDKEKSKALLIERIVDLPAEIRSRLVLENDERNYSAGEILEVCNRVELRGVFDVFHHQIFPEKTDDSLRDIILQFAETWTGDGRQKIHYSNQDPDKSRGAHSVGIDVNEFKRFYSEIKDLDFDVMLETKDKEKSVASLRESLPELR